MAAEQASPAAGKLTFWTKMAYGVGDLGPAITAAINGFFLNFFLLEVAGLRPAVVGTIFLIIKIWDAVNDPLVGFISDKTQTRWGRRRPWLLFGAVPFGLAFFLQWIVPPWSDGALFWYYLVVAFLLDTGYTAVNVPYGALTPELTPDYDERTNLSSYRFSFSILGGVFAAFLHTIIVDSADTVFTGYIISGAIWAAIIIGSNIVTFLGGRETHTAASEPAEDAPGFLEGLKIAFTNKAFILVSVIYLASWLAIQFVQSNLLLYIRYWFDAEEIFGTLVLMIQVGSFIFMLIWSRISERIGKKRVYYYGMTCWIIVSVVLFFIPQGQIAYFYPLAILASVGVAVAYLIPWSMLPDVVELDELQTGQRREGIFYGVYVFLQKLGLSLALAASNFALELTGFVNATPGQPIPEQPEAVLTALRFFVGPAAALVLLLSFIAVYFYPITRESHAAMRAELAQRRAAEANAGD